MSKYERNFKGVWIPADVWLNTDLSIQEKVMLVEIDSLNACPNRGCWANNDHFAKFFGLSKSRVSEVINSLVKKGYLKTKFKRDGKQIVERNIFVITPFDKLNTPLRETEAPPSGNAEENNTNFNNTEVTKDNRSIAKKTATNQAREKADPFDELWPHYPKREGSNPKNRAKQNFNARLKEGHSAEVMAKGLKRYIDYCKAKGQVGTSFVMQAQRFFGTALEFTNDWQVAPEQQGKPSGGMIDPSDTSWIHDEWGY